MKGKYVCGALRTEMGMMDGAILIPEAVTHADLRYMFYDVSSAGFFNVDVDANQDIEVICYGESVSIGVKSDPDRDTILVRRAMGLGPVRVP